MDILNKKLEKFGYTKDEATKFVMTYKLVGISTFIGGWFLCHRFRPIKTLSGTNVFRNNLKKMEVKYPRIYNFSVDTKIKVESTLKNSTFFQKLSDSIGIKKKHLAGSLVEIILIKKFSFPILLPLEMFATYLIVKSFEVKDEITNVIDDHLDSFSKNDN